VKNLVQAVQVVHGIKAFRPLVASVEGALPVNKVQVIFCALGEFLVCCLSLRTSLFSLYIVFFSSEGLAIPLR
jgi:hypothetical protein